MGGGRRPIRMANTFREKDFLIMCSYMSQSADCFMHSGFLLHIISNYALQTLCGSPHNICNDEGKLEQLPFNRGLRDESGNLYDYIAGNFMIVGLGEEDFTSLPPEYIEKYSQLFAQPEILNIANGRFEVLPDTFFEQQESEEPNMSM